VATRVLPSPVSFPLFCPGAGPLRPAAGHHNALPYRSTGALVRRQKPQGALLQGFTFQFAAFFFYLLDMVLRLLVLFGASSFSPSQVARRRAYVLHPVLAGFCYFSLYAGSGLFYPGFELFRLSFQFRIGELLKFLFQLTGAVNVC